MQEFNIEQSLKVLDEFTGKTLLANHEAAKESAESNGDYQTVSFIANVQTPGSHRRNGTAIVDPLTVNIDLQSAITKAMGGDNVPASCFIEKIEVLHARNVNDEDRTVSVSLQSPSVETSHMHATHDGDVSSQNEDGDVLFVVPDGVNMGHIGEVYTASAFANTDTFRRYGKALDEDIETFAHAIPGTGLVSYVSPLSISPEEKKEAQDLGHIQGGNADRVDDPPSLATNDWFLDVVFKNASKFENPPVAAVRPSLKKEGEQVVSFEMGQADYSRLLSCVKESVLAPLNTHLIRLNGDANMQLKLKSDVGPSGGKVTPWTKSTKFDALLKITCAYLQ